ncbi:hypothetical protein R3P38DRAFT_2806700 [Favolaschia claudopus]|uniref:Uncharacterized protein n=1 Tax=Favolaschia claudopus TaxID=2862362 RepID=A0AAV9ZJG9_9AGAR
MEERVIRQLRDIQDHCEVQAASNRGFPVLENATVHQAVVHLGAGNIYSLRLDLGGHQRSGELRGYTRSGQPLFYLSESEESSETQSSDSSETEDRRRRERCYGHRQRPFFLAAYSYLSFLVAVLADSDREQFHKPDPFPPREKFPYPEAHTQREQPFNSPRASSPRTASSSGSSSGPQPSPQSPTTEPHLLTEVQHLMRPYFGILLSKSFVQPVYFSACKEASTSRNPRVDRDEAASNFTRGKRVDMLMSRLFIFGSTHIKVLQGQGCRKYGSEQAFVESKTARLKIQVREISSCKIPESPAPSPQDSRLQALEAPIASSTQAPQSFQVLFPPQELFPLKCPRVFNRSRRQQIRNMSRKPRAQDVPRTSLPVDCLGIDVSVSWGCSGDDTLTSDINMSFGHPEQTGGVVMLFTQSKDVSMKTDVTVSITKLGLRLVAKFGPPPYPANSIGNPHICRVHRCHTLEAVMSLLDFEVDG